MNKKYKPAGKYAIKTFNKKYKDHDRKKIPSEMEVAPRYNC